MYSIEIPKKWTKPYLHPVCRIRVYYLHFILYSCTVLMYEVDGVAKEL